MAAAATSASTSSRIFIFEPQALVELLRPRPCFAAHHIVTHACSAANLLNPIRIGTHGRRTLASPELAGDATPHKETTRHEELEPAGACRGNRIILAWSGRVAG